MPQYQYRITDPSTGRTLTVSGGPEPPTDAEAQQLFEEARANRGIGAKVVDAFGTEIKRQGNQLLDALPTLGSIGGGVGAAAAASPAGPLAMYVAGIHGAAGGAAAGEYGRNTILSALGRPDAPADRTEMLVRSGKEGALGGATEAAGGAVGKGLSLGARGLMRVAAGPSAATGKVLEEFPGILDEALERGTSFTRGGFQRAREASKAGSAVADEAIAAAEAAGGSLDLNRDILRPFVRQMAPEASTLAKGGEPGLRKAVAGKVRDIRQEFRARPPKPTPPAGPELPSGYEALAQQQMELGPAAAAVPNRVFQPTAHEVRTGLELGPHASLVPRRMISGDVAETAAEQGPRIYRDVGLIEGEAIKRKLQKLATRAYKTQNTGDPVNELAAQMRMAQSRAYKTGLERQVPGLADINQETQKLIGIRNLIKEARKPGRVLSHAGTTALLTSIPAAGGALYQGDPEKAAAALALGLTGKAAMSPAGLALLARTVSTMAPAQATLYKALLEAFGEPVTGPASTP